MMRIVVLFAVVLGVVLSVAELRAQSSNRKLEYSGFFDTYYYRGRLAVAVGGGMYGYTGDLQPLNFASLKPGFSLGASYKTWPRVTFGGDIRQFSLGNKEDAVASRGITFTSSNYEFSGFARYFIFEDVVRTHRDRMKKILPVKPYVQLGLALLRYNPVSAYTNGSDAFGDTLSEGRTYPRITMAIPVGAGLHFRISETFSLLTEFNYRFTFNDYLDDVGAVRGNAAKKDGYYSVEAKLQIAPNWKKMFVKKSKPRNEADPDPSNYGGGPSGNGYYTPQPKPAKAKPEPEPDEYEEAPAEEEEQPVIEEEKKEDEGGWGDW